jgi:pilin/secretion family protein with methylation motif
MSVVRCQLSVEKKRGSRSVRIFPQPPAPSPRPRRRGLSLTEVLIAMGILTLGLLGVASIFPVAGFYMHKADLEDRGSAIARSVMNDIVARGMLNPESWYVMTPWVGPGPAFMTFPSDGKYAPGNPPPPGARAKFARPFALTLREALNQPAALTDATLIGKQFGSAFVIDPRGVATFGFANGNAPGQPYGHSVACVFPASASQAWRYYAYSPSWVGSMWVPWSGSQAAAQDAYLWPIRRVTFRQPSTGWQMDDTMADFYFEGNDDLVTELPDRDDRPATQNWDTTVDRNGNSIPMARQWEGDYSWIVTVVPSTNAGRNGMARNPESHAYEVSVVVFYKRPLPGQSEDMYADFGQRLPEYLSNMSQNERAVQARVVSTGLNGGELLLTDFGEDYNKKSAFDGLRTSQWIMLCGPHPNSTVAEPRFSLNWYQVITVDREGVGVRVGNRPFDPKIDRLITVRGPQWPWTPNDPAVNNDRAADNLCVAICRGAVAVHSRTIRLENPHSASSQAVAFGAGGNPNLNLPPYESDK